MDQLQYILQNLHWFVIFIGGLIFFHELGHFIVAKAMGVKVQRFSIGFGPKLLARTWGETEYAISALPLGGYVKMLGEVPGVEIPPEDAPRAFSAKKVWQRSLIVLAGPFFNFVLAFVLYVAIFLGNQTFLGTRLGTVSVGQPAWEAGLRPGDAIVAIDGEPTATWEDVQAGISHRPGERISITFQRDGEQRTVEVVPREQDESNAFQEIETQGRVGISPNYVEPIAGIADPQGPAAAAGVKTSDVVERVNGKEVEAWHEVRQAVRETPAGEPVQLTLKRGDRRLQVSVTPTEAPPGLQGDELLSAADTRHGYTGLVSKESLVAEVEPGTPAASVGLEPGDRLLRLEIRKGEEVRSQPIGAWAIDLAVFQGVDARSDFVLTYQSGREIVTRELKLAAKEEKDDFENVRTRYVFGAQNDFENTVGRYTFDRVLGPGEALGHAWDKLVHDAGFIALGIAKLAQGRIPFDSVGGPIMLFVIAGKSAELGVEAFIGVMALISVNLGLLNLLPIPVLDGGHLLMFGIEAIRRRPPSLRVREIANMIGLALLLLLMVLVFRNDILRFVLPS